MKCLLINPPETNIIAGWSTGERERVGHNPRTQGRFSPPSLGLLYLAACAETVKDVQIRAVGAQNATHDQLRELIDRYQPDVVGIGTMVFTLIDALKTAQTVKTVIPEAKVVFGGIHPTLYPRETIAFDCVDYLIRGEGEYAFRSFLDALNSGAVVESIPGVVSRQTLDPESIKPQIAENLDELPPPAWHLIDPSVENPMGQSAGKPYLNAFTSRGCIGKCAFCNLPSYARRFRKHSARYIFEHINTAKNKYGIQGVFFWDDCFTVDKKRIMELCRLMSASNLNLEWKCFSRIDTVDEEMLRAMAEAGCCSIDFGIETGAPNIQRTIRKNLDLNKAREMISFAYASGVKTNAFFMLGHPGEGMTELKQTLKYMLALPLHDISLNIFVPLPCTDSYLDGLQRGIIEHDYWREFARNPTPDFRLKFWNEIFTDEELRRWYKIMMRRFYVRWVYIWRGFLLVFRRKQLLLGLKWYIRRMSDGLRI